MPDQPTKRQVERLRSRAWFDNPANVDMTALYLERTMNYGLTLDELQSGRPIIGIAQTGSDITPCNRHHLVLASRIRDGIREAGGVAFEFPIHPIQETCKRPTAMLDRNLQYLSLVEILYGYPIDGVVLTTGCDKTTPAQIMAAATVDIPAIVLSGGPMLNGWFNGVRTGSGTILWRAREMMARGRDRRQTVHRARRFVGSLCRPLQHDGHGLDDELAGRGARHEPARMRRDSGAPPRPPGDGVLDRKAQRRDRVEDLKPSSADARGV